VPPAASEAPAAMSETAEVSADDEEGLVATSLTGHAVVIGYGRVGTLVAKDIVETGTSILVVESDTERAAAARADGIEVVVGNAADGDVLAALNLAGAKWLFIAIPEAFEAGSVVAEARKANPDLPIIVRAHYDAEVHHLRNQGATAVVMGEREIARSMVDTVAAAKEPELPPPPVPEPGAGEGLA
jgi:CPA2 family monovalent cation:H+ antiporter-2